MLTSTAKKAFSYLIKAGILLLAFVFIYRRLSNNEDLQQFETLLGRINHQHAAVIMTLVFLLMLLNWLLEAAKWKYLSQKLAHLSTWECIEAVFCGLTWAIFTPNRLGEYGGRVMFLPRRRRIHGVFAMAVGSFGQNVVTNVVGAISIMLFVWYFLHINVWIFIALLALAGVYIMVFILFYFNIRWMVWLLNRVAFVRKYHRFFDVIARYKFSELMRVMGFCVARFSAFSFQYYLLIHLLIPGIPAYDIYMMIFIMFFIQSALPSLDLLDIGVRALTAEYLFRYVTTEKIAVMAAVSAIWLINLLIPAILGSVFVLKLKFFDNNL